MSFKIVQCVGHKVKTLAVKGLDRGAVYRETEVTIQLDRLDYSLDSIQSLDSRLTVQTSNAGAVRL